MCERPSTKHGRGSSLWSRCFWLLMCVAHAPALASVFEAGVKDGMMSGPLGGCIALTACMVFFVLKTLDVPFLRLNLDRRALAIMVLAVGLVHHDCLGPTVDTATVVNCVAIVATASLVAPALAARARLLAPVRTSCSTISPVLIGRRTGNNCLDETQPCCWVLALRLFSMRGPPV